MSKNELKSNIFLSKNQLGNIFEQGRGTSGTSGGRGTSGTGDETKSKNKGKSENQGTQGDTQTTPVQTPQSGTQTPTIRTPQSEPVVSQLKKQKPVVDCGDVWSDNENPFIRYTNDEQANEYAAMFLDWIMTQTPGFLQSGGPYLGQCGLIYSTRPYVNPNERDLYNNATLKRIAQQKISVGGTYKDKVDAWFNHIIPIKNRNELKTNDNTTNKVNPPIEDKKTDVLNVSSTSKVKDSRLEDFYNSIKIYTNSLGLNTYSDPNDMKMTRGICDSILKEYVDLSRLFSSSFDKTGFERKEFAENQTKAKRFLYFCYSKFTKKYSDDPNFRSAMQLPKDWVVNISDINKNDVNESSLKESVIKKLKNKKEMKNLTESVRNKLITVKTKKRIQKESLKIKLSILSKELKNKNYQMMFEKISSEFNNTGKKVLTEEETMSLENGIKRLFSGKESKLKEKVVSHILSKLKLTEGSEVYNKVKTELESTSDSDMLRLITDCNYTAGKIVNSLPDTLMSQMKNGSETESLSGIVRNAMASAIADKSMVDDIKYKVAQLICPSLKDLESNINKESESLISKYLNSED